uniref:Retinol binding protein 1 n=1 Tax=Leptobrachium leishanense TaxID=445787 RepID=A0A8C5M9Y7_9ANUR
MTTDFNGYWKMLSNENFEEYLKALDVNVAIRKIATLLKPDKDIIQNGDHMVIKTLSTFRNYIMDFDVGKEFEEDLSGVDDRKCMTTVSWEDNKLVCVQKGEKEGRGWTQWVEGDELHLTLVSWDGDKLVTVQKGEKNNRGWKQWIEGDKLYLEITCENEVCFQVFKKKN